MAISWGAWDYSGGNGMRVGLEVTASSVTTSSSSVTWTIKVYTENQYVYGDTQTLSYDGSISGSQSFSNTSSGGAVLRDTLTHTYTYSTYGSSPGTRTFKASLSGAYNGVTPEETVTVTIPARPYAAPTAPSSVAAARNSDTQATVSWTRNATSQKPYTSVTVQMRTYSGSAWGSWTTVATTSSTATSYVKTGLSANKVYQFQVKSNNSVGSSGYVASGNVYMTPSAPSSVASSLGATGTSIATTWKNNHYDGTGVTLEIQRSVAGGAYANVATGLSRSTTSWTDTSPGAGTNTYRVRAVQSTGSLSSAYATGNTVSTIVPPLAPTLLSPNGTRVDLTKSVTLTWQHNPGGDNAAQTQYTIEYSTNSGSTWVPLPSATAVASSASTHTIAANTLTNSATAYQWRVRTKGASATFSPNSTAATFTGNSDPVVAITAPGATTTALPLSVTWTYTQAQGVAQAAWQATLYEDLGAGGLVELEARSGTGTTLTTTFTTAVLDGHTYVIKVQAQSTGAQWSNLASVTTVINLPDPAEPVITGEYQLCTGTVVLSVAQLPPLASEMLISTVAIERRVEGGEWVQLASALPLQTTGEADRINLAQNPRATTMAGYWTSNVVGTHPISALTGVTAPFAGGPTTAARATWNATEGVVSGIYTGAVGSNQIPVTAGEAYTASAYVRASKAQIFGARIYWYDAAGVAVGSAAVGAAVSLAANTWGRISVTGTAPTGAVRCILAMYGHTTGTNWASGDTMDATAALIEHSSVLDTYFDGTYTSAVWEGTANASTSRLRIGATIPVDFIDPIPLTKGTNEYRVTGATTAPSYRVSPIIEVEGVDGLRENFHDGLWVFLAYGDGFSNILRLKHDPNIKESAGGVRTAVPFLGRRKPLLLAGANTEHTVSVSGSLYFDRALTEDPGCRDDSPPNDWLTASRDALVVMYRDYMGRRMFGMLSDVDTTDDVPGIASVSFSVTEVDYTEAYG